MNGPEPFRPSLDYGRSLSQGAALGGCVGSLYLATLAGGIVPDRRIAVFAIAMCLGTGFSVPMLCWLSALLEQFLTPFLMRIHRGRIAVFTLAGGCSGILVGVLLVAAWILLRRPIRMPDVSELVDYVVFSTIPFTYGAASGAFTALAMGAQDRKYMDRTSDNNHG